jgi:hypothetical protein
MMPCQLRRATRTQITAKPRHFGFATKTPMATITEPVRVLAERNKVALWLHIARLEQALRTALPVSYIHVVTDAFRGDVTVSAKRL